MDQETHWEKIYRQKAADAVSWYRRHLETRFRMVESSTELHETPFGAAQQFLYCYCRVE